MLFFKHSISRKVVTLIFYVDDIIIITSDDYLEITKIKSQVEYVFEIRDYGNLKYFLGIEVSYSASGISLTPQKYIIDLLKDKGFINFKPISTAIDQNHKLIEEEDETIDTETYQRLIGRLIYLSNTRPNISYSISVLSPFMHSLNIHHLQATFRFLRYRKGTISLGLILERSQSLNLEIYIDVDLLQGFAPYFVGI